MNDWRGRLREALNDSGKKHSAIASDAAVNPTTLSRIINGRTDPRFEAVVRIARAAGVTVGWLLREPPRGVELAERQQTTLRAAGAILLDTFRRHE